MATEGTPIGAGPAPDEQELERRARALAESGAFVADVRRAVATRVVGQNEMVDRLLVGLLAGGHVLLEGVPGLAKTLAVRTLADSVDTSFRRIQFTPDLLPADLLGTLVWDERTREFVPKRGPIFANLILADEVNRAPAKVQSALLEAMQERQVTIGDTSHPLPSPFWVLATQNPIEQEGTYPLPEAQVDRFMLKVRVGYPERDDERTIMRLLPGDELPPLPPVATPEQILQARALLPSIFVDERVEDYVLDLVRSTRDAGSLDAEVAGWIAVGASPRATIFLVRAARVFAFLQGRPYVVPEDVRAVAPDVLRHRLVLTFRAEAEEVSADDVLERLLALVPEP